MADDRLIVALDVPNALAGLELAQRIGDPVGFYKIGLGMLTGGGLALANELKQDHGKRIFLDMKLFDIGATIEAAVRGLAQFELDFLTVLTSLDRDDLDAAMMKGGAVPDLVVERAGRALESGADGVIASPQEAAAIRELGQSDGRLIVTPGVRPDGSDLDAQKRVATPSRAILNGADHIVIGRPVWQADSPSAAAQAILATLP